jgi:asparagine synthetase B (glutamine-hydrolysing)
LKSRLLARGPDHFGQVVRRHRPLPQHANANENAADWSLRFTSTVLALRGGSEDRVTRQPLVDDATASVLCWNGEAWRVGGAPVDAGENDARVVFARLLEASRSGSGSVDGALLDVLRAIEGPFAFVYYDAVAGSVLFGRDRLGRRSLLLTQRPSVEGGEALQLCSVAGEAGDDGWREVEADGIYAARMGEEGIIRLVRHDWVAGEDAADFVSTLGRQSWGSSASGRGGPSCQTYSTSCRSPALAGSTRRCRAAVVR